MNQLLDLGEEFRLADPAATALQIKAGSERLALRIMVADPERDVADFLDRAEIERPAPDERRISSRKRLAEPDIARRRPGADEGRPLPRQRRAFIIADRGTGRQDDRGYLGRRPQPQVDPRDIAVMGPLLQQLDEPPAIAHRRLARLIARAPWQGSGSNSRTRSTSDE